MKWIKSIKIQLWNRKPILRSPDAYIPAINTVRFLEGKQRILIVGDAGGREWRVLKKHNKEIYIIDLTPQEEMPNLIVQSIEEKTPFEDGFFDGVVMNEVLEHLFDDVKALEEIHRVLKDDGVLVLTVPYLSNVQDEPEYHVRVYSPKTIRRLLERCGFQIEQHFCRGFCSRLPQWGMIPRGIIYLFHKFVEVFFRKDPEESVNSVNGVLEKIEKFLGSHTITIPFQKRFATFGGIIKARRSQKKDFDQIQTNIFANKELL